jgi:IclR family pca regulon transcriptional regulator|tara:strand:+ start:781 stop:1614 length:834 start_codon:yes stop_codon:yes gene_type:complete
LKPSDVKETANAKSVVQSLAKGFQVLEAFDMNNIDLSLTQISRRTGLDAGTVFRLVNTLLTIGYLERGDEAKRYRLSVKVLDLGFHAIGRRDMRDLVRPYLRSLVGEVSEAASFCVMDGADVVYVERVHAGLVRLGVDIRIGSRIPAYYTAIGHSILAYLPKSEAKQILNMRKRVKLTPLTTTTLTEIEKRLELVRGQGYAFSDQDTAPMLRVIAAPIMDADGHPLAALSVAAPSLHMNAEQFVEKAVEPLLRAAAEIGRALSISGSAVAATGSAFR